MKESPQQASLGSFFAISPLPVPPLSHCIPFYDSLFSLSLFYFTDMFLFTSEKHLALNDRLTIESLQLSLLAEFFFFLLNVVRLTSHMK